MSDGNVTGEILKLTEKLDNMDAFRQLHKAVFRTAFDFLGSCFPPTRTEEYWTRVAQLMKSEIEGYADKRLVQRLIIAIWEYLDEVSKDMYG